MMLQTARSKTHSLTQNRYPRLPRLCESTTETLPTCTNSNFLRKNGIVAGYVLVATSNNVIVRLTTDSIAWCVLEHHQYVHVTILGYNIFKSHHWVSMSQRKGLAQSRVLNTGPMAEGNVDFQASLEDPAKAKAIDGTLVTLRGNIWVSIPVCRCNRDKE